MQPKDSINPNEKRKILISGAGVAGIVCAILLDKNKYDVELIEQAESFRNIGFSITLWKTGFEIICKIAKENKEVLVEEKDYYRAIEFTLFGGQNLSKLNILDSNNYAFAFERQHLMEILEKILFKTQNSSNIFFKKTIQEIRNINDQVTVTFRDTTQKKYDFVIVSEGISSTTRKLLPIKQKVITMPFYLMYAWIKGRSNLTKKGALFFAEGHLGVIHPPNFKNLFGFYFKKGMSLDQQKKFMFKALNKIDSVNNEGIKINFETSKVFNLDEVYLETYFFNHVVLLGDAAHGRSPTLGFGTSLAVEDALMLCNKINSLQNYSEHEIDKALNDFSTARIERVKQVYKFQSFIHRLISENPVKLKILSFGLKFFLGKIIEKKIKKLASYKIV